MNQRQRLLQLLIFTTLFVLIGYCSNGNFNFILNQFWFASGVLMLVLLSLIDQPHYSKDASILVNGVTGLISLLSVEQLLRDFWFWFFLITCIYLITSSGFLIQYRYKQQENVNKWSRLISRINRIIGRPDCLFSAFFLWSVINQFSNNQNTINSLFLIWAIFIILNIPSISKILGQFFEKRIAQDDVKYIGKIFGVQSKNTFLVKVPSEVNQKINIFDNVIFKYSIENENKIQSGVVLELNLLDQEKWLTILNRNLDVSGIKSNELKSDFVYLFNENKDNEFSNSFVGLVTDNSKIEKINILNKAIKNPNEGDLVELVMANRKVLYQIIEAKTITETLSNKNESSSIIIEAIQLGCWNKEKLVFEKFQWLPQVNTPVYKYKKSELNDRHLDNDEINIGIIPNTDLSLMLNREKLITHHTAIIGMTGTGKSVFARKLIRNFFNDSNTKTICIDFTGEYKSEFKHELFELIDVEIEKGLMGYVTQIVRELNTRYGDQQKIRKQRNLCCETIKSTIEAFLNDEKPVCLIEFPQLANTEETFEYTMLLMKTILNMAKQNALGDKKLCVVLEEAHTIVPETNSMGVNSFQSKAAINNIAQIALQGRKYGVGFLVIAQRTANVSKTILTQCNTIISFQVLDKTSIDFLSNYFGFEMVKYIPKLKFRQAIASGKALRSNVPIIFEVPEQS